MEKECDVILTYCWNRVGYNILKSLSEAGYNVVVADTSKYNSCSLSKFNMDSFRYPNPFIDEEGFIKCLLKNIQKYKPKILLPTHDESLIVAKHVKKFPNNLIIATEDYDKLIKLSDKEFSTKLAKTINIPTPKIYNSINDIDNFPIVFKTKFGNSAKTVFFPKNENELSALFSTFKSNNILIEEFIQGIDYSVDCIRINGLFYASVYKAILTKTKGGGTTTQRIIIDFPQLIKYSKKMLDKVDYNGVCGLDYKYDEKTGRIAFLEINARYTGGLATQITSGFNIPLIHCNILLGKNPPPLRIKIGTKTKWILGDLITLITRISKMNLSKDELKLIMNFKYDSFDDFDKEDKKAFLGEVFYYLTKFLKYRELNP